MADRSLLKAALLATGFTALGPITTSIYTPSLPAIESALATTPAMVQATLTLFLAAFAVAQLVYGPLSDRFGRKPILTIGLAIYIAGSAAAAFAPTIGVLLAARFVQAIGACAGPAIARAMLRDQFAGPAMARVTAIVGTAIALAPAIGPVLGGHLEGWFGWRSVFFALSLAGALFLLLAIFATRETNHQPDPQALQLGRMLQNYRGLLSHPAYMGYVLVTACTFGGMFAYVTAAPFVFIGQLGLSPEAYGWLSVPTTLAYLVGSTAAGRLAGRVAGDRLVLAGALTVVAGGAMMLAATEFGTITVPTLLAPIMVMLAGMGVLFPSAIAGAMGPFPRMAGVASALMGFVQMAIGAIASIGVALSGDGPASALGRVSFAVVAVGLLAYLRLARARLVPDA